MKMTNDSDLALLAGQRTLVRLFVSCNDFSDYGLRQIGTLTSLRELNLRACSKITSAGMKHLAHLDNIEVLDLSGTAVGDEGIKEVAKLKSLRGLTLIGAPVADEALADLPRLKKLETLDLLDTKVTDAGLAHLATMVSLRDLCLSETQTTDSGLMHLYGLKNLRGFSGGTGVTRDGLKELKKHAPMIFISEPDAPSSEK
jgi:hypothetical protein